jgi:hypothetical protein
MCVSGPYRCTAEGIGLRVMENRLKGNNRVIVYIGKGYNKVKGNKYRETG